MTSYIREASVRYKGAQRKLAPLTSPAATAEFFRRILDGDAREHFFAIYLDARLAPIAWQTISIGTANQSLVHPREVFQAAVLAGACSLIVAHNHPSGNSQPSAGDRDVTRRLARAGEILGIKVHDHVIITATSYYSFAESNPSALSSD